MIPWTFKKSYLLLIFTFYYKYLKYANYFRKQKSFVFLKYVILLTVSLECKRKSETASVNTDSQWSKREACFALATQIWLTVNHNTSVTSGEWILCWQCTAWASELGSCQSNLCHSWGYEWSKKNLKIY